MVRHVNIPEIVLSGGSLAKDDKSPIDKQALFYIERNYNCDSEIKIFAAIV